MCNILNIRKIRTTSFHPACDARVERVIGTVKSLLTCIKDTSDIEWDQAIFYVSMSYNTTVQATTKFTPAYLMYGRELSYPLDIILGYPKEEIQFTPHTYAQQLKSTLIKTYELVRKNFDVAHKRQKQYYDEKSFTLPIQENDLIFLRNHVKKPFQPSWTGPFKVLRVINDKVLEIIPTDNSTGKRKQNVSIDNVKKVSIDLQNQIIQQQRRALADVNTPQILEDSDSSSYESNMEIQIPIIRHGVPQQNIVPQEPELPEVQDDFVPIEPERHFIPIPQDNPQRERPVRIRGAPRHLVDYYVNQTKLENQIPNNEKPNLINQNLKDSITPNTFERDVLFKAMAKLLTL